MHLLSCLRHFRILTILLPLAVLTGCGEGTGPQRIQNEPADPFSGPPASCFEFLTFEAICDQEFEIVDFEGGVLSIIDNPQADSNNNSARVLQMQKFRATSGATFGGSVLDFSAVGSDSISAGDSYTIKVWSQRPVNVLFEPEGGGPGSGDEVAHGGTGWEELTFSPNFTGTTSGFVFIFDNGTLGDAGDDPDNWTFYIDDISEPMGGDGGGPGGGGFPITFDDGASPVVTEFGGAGFAIEAGPAGGDGNALKIIRDGGEVFAGAWIAVPEIPNDAGEQTITALVFSPLAGIPMVAKVEFGDNMGSGDVSANEPVVAGWQTLSWTFTNLTPPNVYNRFTLLPNLGLVDSGVSYYFDNIDLVGSGGGGGATTLPVDFEGDAASYDFGPDGGFEGGAASVVTNPDQSGINTSAQVGQMLKFPGAVFGGATLAIESATVEAGSSFTMKVWSQRSVPVLLQPEPQGPGSGVEVTHGGTGWEELTFSLPGLSGTVSGLTIIFDNGTAGAADTDPTNWTFYFDDITLVPPDAGGGGSDPVSVSDFEADAATYDFGPDGGFEGGAASVVANPDQSGINTSAQVGQMLKFPGAVFGGATLALPTSLDVAAGSSFTMKVWSQRSVPVLFQPEPQGPGSGVEVMHGGTGWEELTFSFPALAGTVTGITIIFDNGTAGAADTDPDNWTFYFDDIILIPPGDGGGGDTTTLPVDFEGDVNAYDFGPDGGFEGGAASVVTNPDQSGINTSTQVGQMLKYDGAVFGGATLVIESATVEAGSSFTMKVWSQRSVPVLLQPEPQGPGSGVEVTHGGTGWEELTFSLPSLTGTVSGITIIFDNGTAGAAATDPTNWTFYFDDITLVPPGDGGGGGDGTVLVTFDEATPPEVNEFGGAIVTIDAAPAGGDGNALKVLRDGGEVWAGGWFTISGIPNDAGAQTLSALVYSPTAGIPMVAKLEYAENLGTGEVSANETVVVGWQTLTWTFTNLAPPNDYNRFVILPNLGTADTATSYYVDNITLVGGGDGGGGGGATTLPVDFEGDINSYDFGPDGGFEGGAASVVTNPDQSGINTSTQVGQMLKFDGAVFGGATLAIESATVEAGSSFTMKVWSQRSVPVLLQPEPQGPGSGVEVTHGGTGWEELTFSLPSLSGTVSGITVIFDNGTAGAAATDPTNWTFYFDDITLVPPDAGGGVVAATLPVDFEGDAASYDFGPDGGFEGGAASVVTNPDQSGINTSAQVGQMLKFPGAVFGGATLAIESATVEAGSSFTMKVWSQRSVPVLLQPEPQGPGSGVEVTHGGTGWEELTFSLPGLSGTVSGLTIIFDNGTAGAADTDPTNWTFYFDDITLVPPDAGGGGSDPVSVSDFEADAATYDFGPDGGFEGGVSTVVTNPDQSGINTSAQVAQMQKFPGAVFGGSTLQLASSLDVLAGSSFTMKVWSQRAVKVLFQPEPQGPGSGVEVTHGGTGWEELTFSFPNLSGTVTGITVIFDNGTAGAADTDPDNWTFYYDDITLLPGDGSGGGGGATTLPVDFEGDVNAYDFGPFGGFEGGAASVVTNPDQSGINTSTQVGQMLKYDGAVFGGATLVIESATVEAGSSFTMKVWSQRSVPVLLQPEPQGPGSGVEVTHGGTGWEELTFSLPSLTGTVSGITIIFDNGTAGAAATDPTNWTFYFDDITLVPPGDGGGGGDGTVLVTFDEATPPEVNEFGGAIVTIDAAPAGGDGNALKVLRDGGEVWAGGWFTISGIPNDAGAQTLSALVYSPTAGIPMVAKLEYAENLGTGEVSANETVVVGWQTLTWTFTNLAPPNDYNRFVILPNLGTADTATSYYVDNITLVGGGDGGGGGGATTLPVDFEGDINSYDFGPDGGFEGGAASVVTNPDQSGINTSTQVGQMLKFDGAVFGGATLAIESATVEAGSSFTMKVWSQRSVPVLLQPEPQGPGSGVEVTHGGTGWEELTFSLPSLSGTVSGITVIFDNGTAGAAATDPTNWTFYFDDITLVPGDGGGGGPGVGELPVTFDEATPPAVTEFGGAGYAIEPGPAGGGDGNTLKIVRDGGDSFAGAFVSVSGVPNDQGTQTISAEVYSPTAGIPMVTKLEFGQNMGTGEVQANETVVVGWQTLTWTYTNLTAPNDYNRFVILPNLLTVDTPATSYYFDNIELVGAGGGGGGGTGDLVVDGGFEAAGTAGLQPPWFVFANGGTVSVSNANNNGGSYSTRLQADASSGASFPILKIERVGAGSVSGGESVTVSFDVIDVDTAGAGKTFVAELFTERADPPGGATNEIILDGYDLTSSWQTRVFTTNLGADATNGVSLLFKADCGGNTSCTMDVFIDNVSIVIN